MIEQSSNCSDDRLRSLLQSDDDVGDDDNQLAAKHIAECQRCQSRLEQLAAEPDAWSEARASLLSGDDHDAGRRATMNGRPWARRCWQHRTTAWTESMSRQLLSPPSHPEMLGRIGRYEVERLIGAGGMGVVFKAFDTELNRPVAVKVLAPILAGSGAARQRFAREARAAAAVVHEHVVSIHNVETEGESPFLVMQYVAGESLQGRIDHEGALDVCEILRIGMQTAAGLAAAHAQGLVHRDVKPSNILLEKGVERALLTDFGLARASDDASLTHTGYHPGTPQYMSPEQARGDGVDARSDLFSLGSVIYTMCTGRAPFRAETSYGILRRITDTEPRSIREINPNIPDWLELIVTKLMAKSPDDRFQDVGEVAELLEDCLAHVQQPATTPLPKSVEQLSQLLPSSKGSPPKPLRRRFYIPTASPFQPMLGAAFIFAMIFAGILIVLELNKGKLTIESEADEVPIRVMQGDKVVERLTVTRTGASVRIAAGQYIVEIDGETNGITVEKGTVTLQRGGREIVRIVKEDHAPAASDTANAVRDDFHGVLGSPRVQVKTMLIHVVDEQGRPIRNATVFRNHVYAPGESQRHKIENAKFETDANGTTVISLTGTPHDLRLWATKDGFCPLHAMWAKMFQADGDTIPDEFTFVMRRGTTIGGIVVDATGRPIPDVRVEVRDMTGQGHNINPKRPGKRPVGAIMLAEGDTVVTNAQGRWELDTVPPDDVLLAGRDHDLGDPDKPAQTKPLLNLRFIHPRYEEREWGVPQQKHDVTLDALRANTAKVVLPSKQGSAGDASPFHSMPAEIVLPHQFRLQWSGATERSPTTARFAVPVSEPSHIRLDEIIGYHGLEIRVTIEPTDYASSEEFLNRETGMRIKISAEDLAALKANKLWTFTYEEEQGTVIAVINFTARQRPVTPISDITELNGTWRLLGADIVSDQPSPVFIANLDKMPRYVINGSEWELVRDKRLVKKLDATYNLNVSPQTVELAYTEGEGTKYDRCLFELHGDTLITARNRTGEGDFPASFDQPQVLIARYQRVGVVTDRSDVDERAVSVSLGTADGIRLHQQLQVSDGSSVLGTVEVATIGEHESYARVLLWSADRPIRRGDRVHPIRSAKQEKLPVTDDSSDQKVVPGTDTDEITVDLYGGSDVLAEMNSPAPSPAARRHSTLLLALNAIKGVTTNFREAGPGDEIRTVIVRDPSRRCQRELQRTGKPSEVRNAIDSAIKAAGIRSVRWEEGLEDEKTSDAVDSADQDEAPGTAEITPRWQRWEVRYPSNPTTFARCVDFFGIELGVAGVGSKDVTYLSNVSEASPAVRHGPGVSEKRLYLTMKDGGITKSFIEQAGIATRGRVVLWFYPEETERQLAALESKFADGKSIDLVDKTVFGVRPKADGFEFYVISQKAKSATHETSELSDPPGSDGDRLLYSRRMQNAATVVAAAEHEQDAVKRDELLANAARLYNETYVTYRAQAMGLAARLFEAECYEKLGQLNEATAICEEVIRLRGSNTALDDLRRKAEAIVARLRSSEIPEAVH